MNAEEELDSKLNGFEQAQSQPQAVNTLVQKKYM
jgi:hypothetical protein